MMRAQRISTISLVLGVFGVASSVACNESNPAYFKYTTETSIYQSTGGTPATGGAPSTDTSAAAGGSTAGGADADAGTSAGGTTATAGTKPYWCGATWGSTHNGCGITTGMEAIAKGVPCVAADPQVCYKTCGPDNSGFKSETCTGGVYAEQSDCSFDPACDWSCFKLPDTAPPQCPSDPAAAPQHGKACNIPPCIVCGGTATAQTTGYLDSKSSQKIGYCVCLPATATSTQKWSCATQGTAWPCPGNKGC